MIPNIGAWDPALLMDARRRHIVAQVSSILTLVSEQFHVPIEAMYSNRRPARAVFIRQIAMYLLYECTGLSYPKLSPFVGKKHHTTIMYGHKLIATRMASQPDFRARIEALKAEVRV